MRSVTKRIPLRPRVTALIVMLAALAIVFIVGFGGIGAVEESVAFDTLESTAAALEDVDGEVFASTRDVQARISDGTSDRILESDGWPGINVLAIDADGEAIDGEPVFDAPIEFSATVRCRFSEQLMSCESDTSDRPPLPDWAEDIITQWTDDKATTRNVPGVVQGFVVTSGGATDDQTLILFESDIFSSGINVDVTSGVEDVALVAIPTLLLLLGCVTWFSLGRVLRPVEAMREQVDRIGAGSLDRRLSVPDTDDELRGLAETMNKMLDRLENASETQRQFISDASHELRSPITATGATIEVAKADPAAADWAEVADIVEQENNRLANLVDDLLLLARMDEQRATGTAGRNRPGRVPSPADEWTVDLEEICLAEAARPHPVDVTVRVVSPARVDGDLSALSRAIRNLVDNAAAHAQSMVRIDVEGSNAGAVVRVIDDGPGIPAEYADRVFERFFRIDQARTRAGRGGAGLGLAIARQIAQNHGGSLELDRRATGGASFVLRVPAGEDGS